MQVVLGRAYLRKSGLTLLRLFCDFLVLPLASHLSLRGNQLDLSLRSGNSNSHETAHDNH